MQARLRTLCTCHECLAHARKVYACDRSVALQDQRPSYKALQEVLRDTEGSSSGKTWVERIKTEFAFNRDSLDDYQR